MVDLPCFLELPDEVVHVCATPRCACTGVAIAATRYGGLLLNEGIGHGFSSVVLICRCVPQSHQEELGGKALRVIL